MKQAIKTITTLIILLATQCNAFAQDTLRAEQITMHKFDTITLACYYGTQTIYTGYILDIHDEQLNYINKIEKGRLIESTVYHPNGNKMRWAQYKDGKEEGTWIEWDLDGSKNREGQYRNGYREGVWLFFEQGVIHCIGAYRKGLRHGTWNYFDTEGNIIKQEKFYKDKPYQ
jgi:hypothetical protein